MFRKKEEEQKQRLCRTTNRPSFASNSSWLVAGATSETLKRSRTKALPLPSPPFPRTTEARRSRHFACPVLQPAAPFSPSCADFARCWPQSWFPKPRATGAEAILGTIRRTGGQGALANSGWGVWMSQDLRSSPETFLRPSCRSSGSARCVPYRQPLASGY